uniref:Uncharacterized protein n=1 Tax=Calcidiscus leptoporus TaxID=127549 RepID=A0A7S0J765_9EUKA
MMNRVSARPRAHCDSPWAVLHERGFRGVWQTPGEQWPFAGVGLAIGKCAAAARPNDNDEYCCSAIYGKALRRGQVECIAAVHMRFVEQLERQTGSHATVRLSDLPTNSKGELMSRAVVKKLSSAEFADKAVVYIDLAAGQTLPQLATIHRNMQARIDALFTGPCTKHLVLAAALPDDHDDRGARLLASAAQFREDLRRGAALLAERRANKQVGRQLGWVASGRHEMLLPNASAPAMVPHVRAWQAAPNLAHASVHAI